MSGEGFKKTDFLVQMLTMVRWSVTRKYYFVTSKSVVELGGQRPNLVKIMFFETLTPFQDDRF